MRQSIFGSKLGSLSLRTQLVVLTSLLIALAIAVTSAVTLTVLRSQLEDKLDDELRSNVSNIVEYMRTETDLPESGPLVEFQAFLLDPEGNVVRQISSNTVDAPPPTLSGWTTEKVEKYTDKGFNVLSARGNTEWRIMPFPMSTPAGYSLIMAVPLAPTNTVMTLVALIALIFAAATLFASIAMTWVLVTRAFEPLARVEQTAARIAAGDLSQRIETYNPHTELGHLSASLNTMLSRIEEAFETQKQSELKMRRFVSDASHELRTPLVTIRGYSELYRHGALQDDAAMKNAMGRIEGEAKRMGQMVEDLLTLARIDESRPLDSRPLDLFNLALDATNDAFASAPDREVDLVGLTPDADPVSAPIFGDEAKIRQLLANLMGNALRYTPAGSPLEVAVGVRSGQDGAPRSVVEIRDHGPGIAEEDRQKVFERFYRSDTSRTRETGGTGLGLAIVAGIVGQHHGTVVVEETPGGGATFVIEIPTYSAI